MEGDKFSVYQFFPDGYYERVRQNVGAKEAVEASAHYTQNIAARLGITRRVIIVAESDDYTVFDWRYGEGIVYGRNKEEDIPEPWDVQENIRRYGSTVGAANDTGQIRNQR